MRSYLLLSTLMVATLSIAVQAAPVMPAPMAVPAIAGTGTPAIEPVREAGEAPRQENRRQDRRAEVPAELREGVTLAREGSSGGNRQRRGTSGASLDGTPELRDGIVLVREGSASRGGRRGAP